MADRYTMILKAKKIAIICFISFFPATIIAQPNIPERDRSSFVHYVLSDGRNEPNATVFKLETNDYLGYVIDFGFFYQTIVKNHFGGVQNAGDSLLNLIDERQKIKINCSIVDFRESFIIPPQKHRFYKYLRKSPNKLIKKYFIWETSRGRYHMVRNLKREDELALIVVLFEHQIPVYENGWGIWIDTNTEHSPDPK